MVGIGHPAGKDLLVDMDLNLDLEVSIRRSPMLRNGMTVVCLLLFGAGSGPMVLATAVAVLASIQHIRCRSSK